MRRGVDPPARQWTGQGAGATLAALVRNSKRMIEKLASACVPLGVSQAVLAQAACTRAELEAATDS